MHRTEISYNIESGFFPIAAHTFAIKFARDKESDCRNAVERANSRRKSNEFEQRPIKPNNANMILPTKHMRTQRTLLGVGAEVIALLDQPKTVSRVWSDLKKKRGVDDLKLSFDWFVLSLDLLFSMDAVELNRGRLQLKVAR